MRVFLSLFMMYSLLVPSSMLWADSIPSTIIQGAVYKRQLFRSEEVGALVYVELDEFGLEVPNSWNALKLDDTSYEDATVYSASYYNALRQQYQMLLAQYFDADEGATAPVLMSRQQYEDARTNNTFVTVNNEPMTGVPELETDTVTVVVVHPDRRYESDGSKLVLLQLPIHPEIELKDDTKTVLLSNLGVILHESKYTIGYRSGYFSQDNVLVVSSDRDPKYDLLGPLKEIDVSAMSGWGRAQTGDDGKYTMTFQGPPCPRFSYSFRVPIHARLNVKQFNPKSSIPVAPITMTKDFSIVCTGYADSGTSTSLADLTSQAGATAIEAGFKVANPIVDFPVDLMLLNGIAQLRGPLQGNTSVPSNGSTATDTSDIAVIVDAGGQTIFDGSLSQLQRVSQQQYDFDGDGVEDVALLGFMNSEGQFIRQPADSDPPPSQQGVWLSRRNSGNLDTLRNLPEDEPATIAPDLLRQADWDSQFDNYGLLTRISEADLQDTDIYVFREANGKLLMEVKGIDLDEVGSAGGSANLYFTVGLMDMTGLLEAVIGEGSFWLWENSSLFNPKIYRAYNESLVPGEQVRVIIINRASGYMGSQRVSLQGAEGGFIDFEIPNIILRPPNLRLWAERKNRVELGMNQGEIQHYLIGNEGSGLTDDYYIALYSEWLDQDGTPLPEELQGYGFTGRIAYVKEENKLEKAGFAEHFSIEPGSRMQLVRLPEQPEGDSEPYMSSAGTKNYYLQVSGQPRSRNSSFESGKQTDALQYRPNKFVPVQTPIYDEEASLLAVKAWQHLNDEPPKPVYQWIYRPEYQFSIYDLMIKDLERQRADGEVLHLNNTDAPPEIDYADVYFEVEYGLQQSAFDQLQTYNYEDRELVFALGEYEKPVEVTDSGTIRFEDTQYLEWIEPEDLLALELYANSDAGNILWEYSFASIYVEKEDEEYPDVPLRWDDYYPQLGSKIINIRSSLDDSKIEGRRVRAEVTHVTEGGEATVTAISTTAATAIFEQDNDGKYRAKFKLDGPDLEPSFPYNPRVDHVEIKFSLFEATSTAVESSVTEKWFIKNNSNTDLEEVLAGEAVFVFDGNTRHRNSNTRKGVSTDTVKRFDEVQEMLNQVVPRKRTVTNEMFSYVGFDGVYRQGEARAIGVFKEQFMLNNQSINDNKNSFQKLGKDYGFQEAVAAGQMSNKIVDKETLLGTAFNGADTIPNTQAGGDVGLYELYHNTVVPFTEQLIAEGERYISEPTQSWRPRAFNVPASMSFDYTSPGPGMSYCFGCKQRINEFDGSVADCQAPNRNTIVSWEGDDIPNNHYRGNLVEGGDACSTDLEVTFGDSRYAGLKSREYFLSEFFRVHVLGEPEGSGRAAFNTYYWSGTDCSGFVQNVALAVDEEVASVTIHGVHNGYIASHAFFYTNDRQFAEVCGEVDRVVNGDNVLYQCHLTVEQEKLVRRGDLVGFIGHVGVAYSEYDEDKGAFDMLHAYGTSKRRVLNADGTRGAYRFTRKVVVTDYDVSDQHVSFTRYRLWD